MVVLVDVTYKLMVAIIARQINGDLKEEELEEQYRNKGCVDTIIALNIALKTRCEHSLNSWTMFVNLAKAFDTVSHPLILVLLAKYDSPPFLLTRSRECEKHSPWV